MPPADHTQLLTFFFRVTGRISRLEYGLGTAFILAINLAILTLVVAHFGLTGGPVLVASIVGLPLTVAQLVVAAKRCHDIGLPGSFVLLLVVPVLGLCWLVALALWPGQDASNAYGPPPRFRPD